MDPEISGSGNIWLEKYSEISCSEIFRFQKYGGIFGYINIWLQKYLATEIFGYRKYSPVVIIQKIIVLD